MTQFKDKKQKQVEGVSTALLTYPVLMAADILLYNADCVPVGADQKQHLELTRNLAIRFNSKFSDTFKVPEPLIQKTGAKIMSLQEPTKKMSKSDVLEKASIFILDEPNIIRKKIASAVTDCDGVISYDPDNKPGISNLLTIYSCCEKISIEEALEKVKELNYGEFKKVVAESVVNILSPIQERYKELINDNKYLDEVLDNGAQKATYFANKMVAKVKRKMGIGRKK
jgi:tryptophanyl-tRNA synthetase